MATRYEHGLHLVSVDGVEIRLASARSADLPRVIEFSPDGSLLAAGFNSGRIVTWRVETGDLVAINEEKREGIGSLAFTSDGKTIYGGCFRGEVWRFSLDLRGEMIFNTGEDEMQGSLVALRDQERELIVVGGYWKTVARAIHTGDKRLVRTFHRGERGIQFLHLEADLSADGRFLITCKSREADIWDATSATYLRTISDKDHGAGMDCATFSPDTQRVLIVGFSGIQLWDHVGGKKIWDLEYQLLPDVSAFRAKPRFTTDGRRFAVVRPSSNGQSNEIAIFEFID
ncbi:hypothetical protein PLCT2_02796 [Planctomycetaceae bacterium]|nr:hypothetical protein PLCT2_02796 [Planctomycetaceae bacterium]